MRIMDGSNLIKNHKIKLTLKCPGDNIFKVLPFILVTLEDVLMSYEKVAQAKPNLIIGTKQTLKAIKNGEVQELVIADDADQKITGKLMLLAKEYNVPQSHVNSMKKLGKACGIDVSAATVAIKQ